GGYLSLAYTPAWTENMTAGLGWIAIALVIFSTWNPLRLLGGAYLFGAADALGFRVQLLGVETSSILLRMLPYLFTLVVLVLINAFHRICRRQRVPVIHVKTVLRASGVDDTKGYRSAWRLTFPMTVGPIPNADAHGLQGTRWTEFVTEVLLDDHVVDSKKRLSIFYPTDLDFLLRNLRRRTVVLTGGFTDCCVLNAAFDAANRD